MPIETNRGNAALRLLAYINLINAAIVFFAAILIFCRAPSYMIWLAGVAASEVPVQIAFVGLVLLMVSLLILRFSLHRNIATASATMALLASVLAIFDTATIYAYEKAEGQKLSWSDTFNFQGLAENARKLESREYARHGEQALSLDVYEPIAAKASGLRPAVIVIHGGSWRHGRRSDFAQYDYWMAGLGYTVFDLDYRLCNSKVHFPAPLEDIELARKWIDAHAAEYHVDRTRLATLGRSAGAQMALVSGYSSALPGSKLTPIRCVVALYGPTDLVWNYDNPVLPDVIDTKAVLENYLGGAPSMVPAIYAQATAQNLVCKQTPATLFLHGGRDQVVDSKNVDRLTPILESNKIPFEYCFLPWANHGFDWHFNGYSSQLVKARISKFLEKYL